LLKGENPVRRQILLTSVGAVAIAGSALAAEPPLQPPPTFTWTGFYLGGQIGWARSNDAANAELSLPLWPRFFAKGYSIVAQGVIGGAHIGYNLQINQWIIGLEGTVDGTSLSGSVSTSASTPNRGPFGTLAASTREDVQGSIRARAGIAWDRVLVYATGGAAFTGISNNYSAILPAAVPASFFGSSGFSKTLAGWTVGGGLEYAVTNNWSLRAEYRYSDFGHYTDFPFSNVAIAPAVFNATTGHRLTEHQVQGGFSYKFDTSPPAPLVAKY
jgi:outer membrane immunogenic protein